MVRRGVIGADYVIDIFLTHFEIDGMTHKYRYILLYINIISRDNFK